MIAIKFIIFILFLTLVALFSAKNMGPVDIHYYDLNLQLQSISLPAMVVILVAFGTGFLLAWFIESVLRIKLKVTVRKLNKTIRSLEKELEKLKPPPKVEEAPVPVINDH